MPNLPPILPASPMVSPQAHQAAAARDVSLAQAAQDLEATFLAEMLKAAGLGETRNAFGGGAGEEQFSSLLVSEHAKALAKSGGIGLAEQFLETLQRRAADHDNN